MKIFDYPFFLIYNWYYKDGMYNRKIDPGQTAIHSIILGIILWIVMLMHMFNLIINKKGEFDTSFKVYAGFIAVVLMAFLYNYYYFSDRYLRIYNQFVEYSKQNKNRKRDLVITFIFLYLPFPVIVIWGIIK